MIRRLHHPLWTHVPAGIVYLTMVVLLVRALPLPEQLPTHFDAAGKPNGFSPPWLVVMLYTGFPLLFMVGSAVVDEMWARQERRKRFNWLAPADEALVGFMGGIGIAQFLMVARGQMPGNLPWAWALGLMGGAVPAAVVLELLRPFRPAAQPVAEEEPSALRQSIAQRMASGQRWTYLETQDPPYLKWLVTLSTIGLLAGTVVLVVHVPWAAPLALLGAALCVICYGGLVVVVNEQRLEVRLGVLRVPLLRLRLVELREVSVREFSPISDFGGWGIRANREMRAFYFRGRRGVVVQSARGKRYLIGSDYPERLAAVLDAVRPAGV